MPEIGAVSVVFVKYGKRQKVWRAFICTDLTLSAKEIMSIYGDRWGIEVMFKELKTLFSFGKYHGQDFDGQIAMTALALTLYTLLAVGKLFEWGSTIGNIFRRAKLETQGFELASLIMSVFEQILNTDFEAGASGINIEKWKESFEYRKAKELLTKSLLSNLPLVA